MLEVLLINEGAIFSRLVNGEAIDNALQRILDELRDPDTTTNIVAVTRFDAQSSPQKHV